MKRMSISILGTVLFLYSAFSFAHHSRFGTFEYDRVIDIEGIVTDVSWKNPHVRFDLDVTDAAGTTQHWEIEATAMSMLRNMGLDQEFLQVGDRVKMAGNPTINGDPELIVTNVLLMDGTEVLLDRDATAYFSEEDTGRFLESVFDTEVGERARLSADGIFRTWSKVLTDSEAFPMFKGEYPLTEAAAQAKADWIPDTERLISCWVKAMPFLMITPHPVEFVQQGEDILMRFEEDDAERLVHMNSNDLSSQNGSSLLGYSQGFWQGNTLLVETTNIDSEAFDDQGTPVSKDIRLVERFTLSEDEQRLDYRISIFDSETFAQPFDLTSYWVWRPEREVQEWDCVDS